MWVKLDFLIVIFWSVFSSCKVFLAIKTFSSFFGKSVFVFGSSLFANTIADNNTNGTIIIFFIIIHSIFKLLNYLL